MASKYLELSPPVAVALKAGTPVVAYDAKPHSSSPSGG